MKQSQQKKNQHIGIKIACRKAKTEPQENQTNPQIETSSKNAYQSRHNIAV